MAGAPRRPPLTPAAIQARLQECTGIDSDERTARQQRNLDDILAVTRIQEKSLKTDLLYATYLFQDIVFKRLGGRNPFGNRGVRYTGSHDDKALNAGVARFSPDPSARRDLSYDSDLTGRVNIPVLSLHAINDPQVVVEHEAAYRATLKAARPRRASRPDVHDGVRARRVEQLRVRRLHHRARQVGTHRPEGRPWTRSPAPVTLSNARMTADATTTRASTLRRSPPRSRPGPAACAGPR